MASGFYNDDSDIQSYRKTVALCVAAASLVVLLFLVILYLNTDRGTSDSDSKQETVGVQETQDNFMENAHNFTSDELEFWEDKEKEVKVEDDESGEVTSFNKSDEETNDAEEVNSELSHDEETDSSDVFNEDNKTSNLSEEEDGSHSNKFVDDVDSDDENHISITLEDGTKKYYEILSDVPKNDYDFEKYLENNEGRLSYKDTKRTAVLGVDLSKYNGNVDFSKLKDAGVNFAMLRLGSRGYGSGTITLDDKFVEYAQNAALAGIYTGAYFYSSAINEAEAIEEANYIVGAVSGFNIKYPIAIDVEKVTGDTSRTEKLTVAERTAIVKAFCDTVKGYGYNPIIYAHRDLLISGLNLEDLDSYDVWLCDYSTKTDYPYRFSLWQFTQDGKVQGIDGNVDLDLCFIKYEEK